MGSSRVSMRKGAYPITPGNFYKVFIDSVLLFGAETWIMTWRMTEALKWMHRGVARRITDSQTLEKVWGCSHILEQ